MDYIERLSAEIILVIVVGFASIGGILWFWPSPLTALIIAAAFVGLFFAYDFYVKYGDEEAKAPNGAYDLIPILILGIFMLPLAGWSLGQVRANLLEYVGPYSATVSGRALNDGALSVRAIACSSITIHHNDSVNFENLPNQLDKDTRTSFKCLKRLKKKAQSKAAEGMLSGHKLLADRLAERWWGDLMNQSKISKSKACASAEIMTYAYQYTNSNWRERLFTCSLAASTSSARSCCQEEAKMQHSRVFQKVTSHPTGISPDLIKENYDSLATTAFEQLLETSSSRKLPTKWARQRLQDWVVSQGCRFIAQPDFFKQFIESFSKQLKTCKVDKFNENQFFEKSNWYGLCDGLYQFNRTKRQLKPNQSICKALEQSAVRYSVSRVKSKVRNSIADAAFEANGSDLNLSNTKYRAVRRSDPNFSSQGVGQLFQGLLPGGR